MLEEEGGGGTRKTVSGAQGRVLKAPGYAPPLPPRRGHVCSLRSTVAPLMLPGWLRAGCEGGAGSWGAVQTGSWPQEEVCCGAR